ncbi:NEDD8-activating enzyme E1 regulatory subunit AXR1-like protein [Tanacetum coccineum]
MDEDISRLKTTAVSLLTDLGCNGSTLTEDLINEMCRYGAAELHAVAAYIGGVASQEIIKPNTTTVAPPPLHYRRYTTDLEHFLIQTQIGFD